MTTRLTERLSVDFTPASIKLLKIRVLTYTPIGDYNLQELSPIIGISRRFDPLLRICEDVGWLREKLKQTTLIRHFSAQVEFHQEIKNSLKMINFNFPSHGTAFLLLQKKIFETYTS